MALKILNSTTHYSASVLTRTILTLTAKLGIVASGMSYSLVYDVIQDLNLEQYVTIFKVLRVFPV